MGIKETELEGSIRPVDWLRINGKCLDNLRPGVSNIEGAGRGAFATRFIPQGYLVAPAPLIHIPYKEAVLMHSPSKGIVDDDGFDVRNITDIIGKQLILNYCFGHPESTVLLCPYGSGTSYINHNHQSPNVKIIWPDETHAIVFNLTWTKQSVDFLEDQFSPGLEFDYVALRDIEEGEEVVLDYGIDWEEAWNKHVEEWTPVDDADKYEDASQWNCLDKEECETALTIRTEEEQRDNPYSKNLTINCYFADAKDRELVWIDELDDWTMLEERVPKFECKILERHDTPGSVLYDVEIIIPVDEDGQDDEEYYEDVIVVTDVPQYGIQFVNKPYTSDLFLPNAFRHEIGIPDSMMPASWKNLVNDD